MADVFDKTKRSEVMSLIRSKDTKPEMVVRTYLHRNGFRYKLHVKHLPGKPDLVLPKYNVALFVNGCFWHCHTDSNCKIARTPKSNTQFWKNKFQYNEQRQKKDILELTAMGWRVVIVWECYLRRADRVNYLCNLENHITNSNSKILSDNSSHSLANE